MTPALPFARALHAEWTKFRTEAGPVWLLFAAIVSTVAISAGVDGSSHCAPPDCAPDATRLSLTGVMLGQAAVAILAVLAIGNEYGTGMIRTTFTAIPRRATVLAAKAAVLTGTVLAAGAAAVLASLGAGRLVLPGRGFTGAHGHPPISLADGPTLRAAAGSVLYLVLIALLALGVATAVRDSAAAVGTVLGLLYLFPIVIHVIGDPDWQRRLEKIAPMPAGLAVQATTGLSGLPISPWRGLGVLAVWAAGALLAAIVLLRARDA
ncbi:ABC transporter permease [Actinomadura opuntiae]|uniref:ABC transporter permease n=1 Tax=Actinomadura sp. OS1-43 TaxID=604315 RepID=UPI00255AC930|nr:ABC transporter permease [Actinomadura sp. OS1-43]MDL4817726.1 ABC transporter permease [Actinomadura sp. OS1-43]